MEEAIELILKMKVQLELSQAECYIDKVQEVIYEANEFLNSFSGHP